MRDPLVASLRDNTCRDVCWSALGAYGFQQFDCVCSRRWKGAAALGAKDAEIARLRQAASDAEEGQRTLAAVMAHVEVPPGVRNLLAELWRVCLDAGSWDGVDLQDMMVASGIAGWRPCTAEEAQHHDYAEEGDPMIYLTPEGKRLIGSSPDV